MGKNILWSFVFQAVLLCANDAHAQKMEEIEAGNAKKVVQIFYDGWSRLSKVLDLSGSEAAKIECEINACAEGGDDCLNKAQIDLPREFDHLTSMNDVLASSIRLGPYLANFENFIRQMKATVNFSSPRQIASVRGLARDLPSYFCFVVDKTYTWDNRRSSRNITDTIWVKRDGKCISGVRNEFGGSGMVHFDPSDTEISYSEADLSLQAALYYDQKKYDEAFKIYRKLAYDDIGNRDAQYNLVLMEHRKQGCKWMGDDVRKAEMAWFVEKNKGGDWNSEELLLFTINSKLEGVKVNPTKMNMPGTEISPAVFSTMAWTLKPFSKGLMVVKNKKNKYGFANERGEIVIPYQYDLACSFDESGLALVSKNGLMGYINPQGAIVIPCQYKLVQAGFPKGRAFCLKEDKTYLIDTKGSIVKIINKPYRGMLNSVKTENVAFLEREDGKWDIYDYDGNLRYSDCTSCNLDYLHMHLSVYSPKDKKTIYDFYNW